MEIRYCNDAMHNYMIVDVSENYGANYQYRMLEKNRVEGLLPMSLRNMDGAYSIYYEIDSKQSLRNRYERRKMNYEKLISLLEGILNMTRVLGNYLLDGTRLMLTSECIFEELGSGRFFFVYNPEYENDISVFAGEILDMTDSDDEKAMELSYGLCERLCEGAAVPARIIEEILGADRKEEKTYDITEKQKEPEKIKQDSMTSSKILATDAFASEQYLSYRENSDNESAKSEEEKKKEKKERKIAVRLPISADFLMAILFAMVAGVLWYIRFAYILTYEENLLDIGVFMVTVMMSLTCFLKHIRRGRNLKSRGKKDSSFEEQENVSQDNIVEFSGKEEKEGFRAGEIKASEIGASEIKYSVDSISPREPEEDENEETVLLGFGFSDHTHKLYAATGTDCSNICLDSGSLPLVIGKLESCVDEVLKDKSVSRMHARVYKQEGGSQLYLQDLNSTNGTYINGKRLLPNERVALCENDEIAFGKCEFVYR